MEKELILLKEYCEKSCVEPDFLMRLENEGLIETEIHNDGHYLATSQLSSLEMFTRLYYDLSINIEGIDVINNLLQKMRDMERELSVLRRQFDKSDFFESDLFIEDF